MSTFTSKLNKPAFDVDTADFDYIRLADLYKSKKHGGRDTIHAIDGVFISKSQFGLTPVVINVEYQALINIPMHMAKTFEEILADPELVQMIKDRKAGFTIYTYESHGKECYSINFANL